MWSFLLGSIHVCVTGFVSSGALLAYLGVLQWFDLLNRGNFSFYFAFYREAPNCSDWSERLLPADVLREIALGILLAPFWGVDMTLPRLPFAGATDASSENGIGGCTAVLPHAAISELGRAAERDGGYVTLKGVVDKPCGRSLGVPHHLAVGFDRFSTIFSVCCSDGEHINLREARALLFYLRWLLRSRNRHRHRVIVLVDSRIVVGAVAKGRSGSMLLNSLVRKIYALCFARGLRLQLIYIPTEHNPGDFPSRGARIPGRQHRHPSASTCPACGARPEKPSP